MCINLALSYAHELTSFCLLGLEINSSLKVSHVNGISHFMITFGQMYVKAAKYEIQKPSTCRATLFRCKFLSMFPVFRLARST